MKMRRTQLSLVLVTCKKLSLALTAYALTGRGQEARKQQKLRIGIPSRSMSSFPQIVALSQGFYQQEGFDLELIVVSSGIPAMQAVVAGDLDFTTTGNVATLAALRGMPIRNVMVSSTATDQTLWSVRKSDAWRISREKFSAWPVSGASAMYPPSVSG